MTFRAPCRLIMLTKCKKPPFSHSPFLLKNLNHRPWSFTHLYCHRWVSGHSLLSYWTHWPSFWRKVIVVWPYNSSFRIATLDPRREKHTLRSACSCNRSTSSYKGSELCLMGICRLASSYRDNLLTWLLEKICGQALHPTALTYLLPIDSAEPVDDSPWILDFPRSSPLTPLLQVSTEK